MDKMYEYLSRFYNGDLRSNSNLFLIKDLKMSSKEIIDFVIFLKKEYRIIIPIYEDITLHEIIKRIENEKSKP